MLLLLSVNARMKISPFDTGVSWQDEEIQRIVAELKKKQDQNNMLKEQLKRQGINTDNINFGDGFGGALLVSQAWSSGAYLCGVDHRLHGAPRPCVNVLLPGLMLPCRAGMDPEQVARALKSVNTGKADL